MPEKPHGPPAPSDIKKTINRYYDDCMASSTAKKKGNPKEYCARVAWQRFCMNKNPDHPSCTKYGKTRATMEDVMPFKELFENLKRDGAVEREEFDTLSNKNDPVEEAERTTLEDFILGQLRPHEIFHTAEGKPGVVYHDRRGRAVSAVVDEMDDGEVQYLARVLHFDNEAEPPLAPVTFEEIDGPIGEDDVKTIIGGFYSE